MSSDVPLALWPPATGRSCGTCSMCCGPAMQIMALEKHFGEWCPHCRPGKGGCGIYETRPEVCRSFACSWVRGSLPDALHPLKVGAVIGDYHGEPGQHEIIIWVDPADPDAAQKEPLKSWVAGAARFAKVRLVCGERIYFAQVTTGGLAGR